MNLNESRDQRTEVTLYRCACHHCDNAQEVLERLTRRYEAALNVENVDKIESLKDSAGWSTPMVYVNGRRITHFSVRVKKWEEAIQRGLSSVPLKVLGEVLDLNCYLTDGAKGSDHKSCATSCIKAGGPMGLLPLDGQVYLLLQDRANKSIYEVLKTKAAEKVMVTGEVCRRGGMQAMIVKVVERPPEDNG